jgi:uracil-DNA glycosylase family 4
MIQWIDFMRGLPGKGEVPADIVFCGMAPSPRRPHHRRLEPFGSRSYSIVDRIREARGPTHNLYFTNLVKEPVPSGKKLGVTRIREWMPQFIREMQAVQPKRIIALGSETAAALCPGTRGLHESHGIFFENELFPGTWIIPTYHFSAVAHSPELSEIVGRDLQRAFDLPDPKYGEYQLIESPEVLRPLISEDRVVIIDLETADLERESEVLQIGFGFPSTEKAFICRAPDTRFFRHLALILKEENSRQPVRLVMHNAPFDLAHLVRGSEFTFPRTPIEDTMLMAHTMGETPLNLKHLGVMYTDFPGFSAPERFSSPIYLAEDVRMTRALFLRWDQETAEIFSYHPVSRGMVPVATSIRTVGVKVDPALLAVMRNETVVQHAELTQELCALGEADPLTFNWNSTAQVEGMLLQAGVPLSKRTASGASFSVAEDVLLPLREDWPLVDLLLRYREVEKLLSGFLQPYLEIAEKTGFLYPKLNLAGAVTGRISCSDPNLQQVPREGPLKRVFVSRFLEGLLALVDFGQAELRVAAYLADDEVLASSLLSQDVHLTNAALVLEKDPSEVTDEERKFCKRITFGLLYGGSPEGIAYKGGVDVAIITSFTAKFFARFKKLARWLREQGKLAETGDSIPLPFGRKRGDLQRLRESEGSSSAYRKAVNTPIQGTASELTLFIVGRVYQSLLDARPRMQSRVAMTIHDSLLLDIAPGELEQVVQVVQHAFSSLWDTPLAGYPLFQILPMVGELKVGKNWATIEETNDAYAPEHSFMCSSHLERGA